MFNSLGTLLSDFSLYRSSEEGTLGDGFLSICISNPNMAMLSINCTNSPYCFVTETMLAENLVRIAAPEQARWCFLIWDQYAEERERKQE